MSEKTITSFKEIEPLLTSSLNEWNFEPQKAWQKLDLEIFRHRVKFPILEKIAIICSKQLTGEGQQLLVAKLSESRHISSYPVIGKMIQLELNADFALAYQKAKEHIIQGDQWYVCDIISERVFGEGTLRNFEASYLEFQTMANHENIWIQRSIGIASHYATKKKLPKHQVELLFKLMLENGHKTQLYIKKGIGWAAKTIGKYHPDILHGHAEEIKHTKLSKWFLRKMDIGLSMAKAEPLDL